MKLSAAFILLFLVSFSGRSQTVYPPTIRVPVTIYDFHADGSNPDFEPGLHSCGSTGCLTGTGLHLNEVGTTLTAQRKPFYSPGTSVSYFSERVAKWFVPWQPGDFTIPFYATSGAYLRDSIIATDTSYKNVVIPDSLTFTLVPGSAGIYKLSDNAFFRLDGKGFGNEPAGTAHNYSFTMEMHWEFTYQTGLTFDFASNDDMWVFVNGQRVVDLGGLHPPTPASVNLDNTPVGMTVGRKYMLDVFYAQRHVTGCAILITTNIISASPGVWIQRLTMAPEIDSVYVDSFIVYHATLYDDEGTVRHDLDSLIHWTLYPTGTASSLSSATGGVDTLFLGQSYTTNIISASYTDVNVTPPRVLTVRDTIYIRPSPDYRVWIEPDANIDPNVTTPAMLNRLRNPAHVSLVTMTPSETQTTVFAVVRDQFGNFIRFANNAQWSEVPITDSLIQVTNGTPPYIGLIDRPTAVSGTTRIRVSAKDLVTGIDCKPDTTMVMIQAAPLSEWSSIVKAIERVRPVYEYYNLRGQRLRELGAARVNSVVLERIMGPGGKANVTRKILGTGSESRIRNRQ
jgi:fibro-slime domain-containing protein